MELTEIRGHKLSEYPCGWRFNATGLCKVGEKCCARKYDWVLVCLSEL